MTLVKKNILGIKITDTTLIDVSEYIVEKVKKGTKHLVVVTPNPEMVVFSQSHKNFKTLINEADIAICDGVGLYLASHIVGTPVLERVTGVDLMEKLCSNAVENALNIGLLGGRPGVAEGVSKCLREKYHGLKISFTEAEWDKEKFPKTGVDFLFVAYGFPKQEEWITENIKSLPIGMSMGVGGAFDYLSGNVLRAPFVIRALGFEWLFRLIRQPWRIKRQLKLLSFILLVIRTRLSVQ